MKKNYIAFAILFSHTLFSFSQTLFESLVGSETSYGTGMSGIETPDGGYVIAGLIDYNYCQIVKVNNSGTIVWSSTLDLNPFYSFYCTSIELDPSDHGFLLAGTSDNSSAFGKGQQGVLIKTDSNGTFKWGKHYGGADDETINWGIPTSDGGSILGGYTNSSTNYSYDFYLVKTNNVGAKQWDVTFDNTSIGEAASSVCEIKSGSRGYVAGGYYSNSTTDGYLVRTDTVGNLMWCKAYKINNAAYLFINSVQETSDKGLICLGVTDTLSTGNTDMVLIKTDSNGIVKWSKVFGGIGYEEAKKVVQTSDKGFIITGTTASYGFGAYDGYLIKTDSVGNLQWSKTYGAEKYDFFNDVRESKIDGGFAAFGYSNSDGLSDETLFIVKTDAQGNSIACNGTSPQTSTSNIVVVSYTLTPTQSTVGSSASTITKGTYTVAINQKPVLQPAIVVRQDTAICKYDELQLSASGGLKYSWSPIYALVSSTGSKKDTTYARPLTTTTFSLMATNKFCIDTIPVKVTVNILPTTVAISNVNLVCNGTTDALLTVSGGDRYVWTPSSGLGNPSISNPIASPTASVLYTARAYIGLCSSTDSIEITVYPTPTVIIASKAITCSGESTQLSAGGGTSYIWSPTVGINSAKVANPTVTPLVTTTYTVTVSNGVCLNNGFVTVLVNDLPQADFDFNDSSFANTSTGGTSFNWDFGDGYTSKSKNPTHQFAPGVYDVTLIATNGCGADTIIKTFYIGVTGAKEYFNSNNIIVYPNPNNGSFNIQLNSIVGKNMEIKLSDINGRIVFEQKATPTDTLFAISVNDLPKGIYSLIITTNSNWMTKKVVIL